MGIEGECGGEEPRTVLIAEDDAEFRETVAIWLETHDGHWQVREASNGREALEKVDETVDVLVLDRRMPERTGHEVVDRLDETPFDGPIIAMTAYEPDYFLTEDDVDAYLVKPIEREEFLDHLEPYAR